MDLIYIDESGNTGSRKDPDQPIHLIAGLIVHESRIRPIEDQIDQIAQQHFPEACLQDGFELHGADLFSGKGCFKGIAPAVRVQAIADVLKALADNEAKIGWAAADKLRVRSGWHPHRLAFVLLIERLELHLRNAESLGLIVADENKEVEQRLIDDLNVYKRSTTGFGWRPIRIRQIVDSIHFVQSKNNRLIQCADLIAYFVLRGYRLNQRLIAAFLAAPEPKGTLPDWTSQKASQSEKGILGITQQIQQLTVFSKLFP
jgi:hypothetical protein